MTPIYKKVGRRYVEIGTYDNEQLHYPHGAHLVWSRPGGVLTRYTIKPADAALLAAMELIRPFVLSGPCLQDIVEAGINAARKGLK